MIVLGNANSSYPAKISVNNSALKPFVSANTDTAKSLPIDIVPSQSVIKKYNDEQNYQNNTSVIQKYKLSYSTLSAINQYTNNANLERVEKENALLGLSLYA